MPDSGSLAEIKISELPVAETVSGGDQVELNQAGFTRSGTLAQIAGLAPPPDLSDYVTDQELADALAGIPPNPTTLPPSGPAGGALAGTYPNPSLAVPYPVTLPPNGPAGGDLQGTYPNPTIKSSAFPAPPTTLPPSGAAGGALTGTYPNPTLVGGPLSNYALSSSIPTTLPPNGAAGGDLSGTYPNPKLKPAGTNGFVMTTVAGVAAWAAASGGASTSVGDTPPVSPSAGALWWNSVLGTLFIYYNDGNSTQWVPAAPSAATATPPFPAPGVLSLYSEKVCVGGETQMDVAIPPNAKRVELEWMTRIASGSPAHLLQVVESGVPNAAGNYSFQSLYGNGSAAGAGGSLSQTSWSISGGSFSAVSIKFMPVPGANWFGLLHQSLIQASSRYYQAYELDFTCNTALTTGFRVSLGSSSFNAGSFFRAYVVV